MIVFYTQGQARDKEGKIASLGIRKRKSVATLPGIGRVVPGHGTVWKLDHDDIGNIQVHVR
jgi:hypothetical protein